MLCLYYLTFKFHCVCDGSWGFKILKIKFSWTLLAVQSILPRHKVILVVSTWRQMLDLMYPRRKNRGNLNASRPINASLFQKTPTKPTKSPLWNIEQFAVPRFFYPPSRYWGLEPEVPSLVNHTGVKKSSVKSAVMEGGPLFLAVLTNQCVAISEIFLYSFFFFVDGPRLHTSLCCLCAYEMLKDVWQMRGSGLGS